MKNFKRIIASAVVVCAVLMTFASCGPEALGMYPTYIGPEVTSTNHEFTKDDFYVIVAFDDGSDRSVDDFEFEVIGMEGGEYEVNIIYGEVEYPVFVPIHVAVYPSELGGEE